MAMFVGIDDQILEGVRAGAVGWIAGLANALPRESVELFRLGRLGDEAKADRYWTWFLPLLRLDADPRFVQFIKFVQSEVGQGSARVRPPRQPLSPAEAGEVREILRAAKADPPA
jgi:4-hydroxy-tetrahydrodipicolinate synthase